MSKAADFSIHYSAFLGEDGKLVQALPDALVGADTAMSLYRAMTLARAFDAKAIALQRTGRLGTYASCLGQEAVAAGVGWAMQREDVLLPSFREHGAQMMRGVKLTELLAYWGGDERGSDFAACPEDFPVCITVGGHAPHAAGVALAMKLRGEARAAVCVFGDGATSKGDVYEAMNLAGAWQLPVLFVINNNQWAISTPRRDQTRAQTLAQKGIAVGIQGEQVDGNDVFAVCHAMQQALVRAYSGHEPALIECVTYRLGDHTTSDDASRYRSDEEVSQWWQRDPLARLRTHLAQQHGWGRTDETALLEECRQQVEQAVDEYLATAPQAPAAIFDYTYAQLPEDLVRQKQLLLTQDRPDGSDHG
jgi:pyruvate dehydrogenase E1 component alpha subunit